MLRSKFRTANSLTTTTTTTDHPYPSIPAKYSRANYMQYCIGSGVDLTEAHLSFADLRWQNFRNTCLKRADLSHSLLWGSILTHADLRDANLSYTDFTGVDLVGADLRGANLTGTCFFGARYDETTLFPNTFKKPEDKGMCRTLFDPEF